MKLDGSIVNSDKKVVADLGLDQTSNASSAPRCVYPRFFWALFTDQFCGIGQKIECLKPRTAKQQSRYLRQALRHLWKKYQCWCCQAASTHHQWGIFRWIELLLIAL